MANVLALVPELMLASRVEGMLSAAGHEVTVRGDRVVGEHDAGYDVIVCDLESVDVESVAAAGPPVLGFYSHVNVEARGSAVSAGVDLAVPRSRMARELPELVERLLAS